jgi:hypothetical protein
MLAAGLNINPDRLDADNAGSAAHSARRALEEKSSLHLEPECFDLRSRL